MRGRNSTTTKPARARRTVPTCCREPAYLLPMTVTPTPRRSTVEAPRHQYRSRHLADVSNADHLTIGHACLPLVSRVSVSSPRWSRSATPPVPNYLEPELLPTNLAFAATRSPKRMGLGSDRQRMRADGIPGCTRVRPPHYHECDRRDGELVSTGHESREQHDERGSRRGAKPRRATQTALHLPDVDAHPRGSAAPPPSKRRAAACCRRREPLTT